MAVQQTRFVAPAPNGLRLRQRPGTLCLFLKQVIKCFVLTITFLSPHIHATLIATRSCTFRTPPERARNEPEQKSPTNFSLLNPHYHKAQQTTAHRNKGSDKLTFPAFVRWTWNKMCNAVIMPDRNFWKILLEWAIVPSQSITFDYIPAPSI